MRMRTQTWIDNGLNLLVVAVIGVFIARPDSYLRKAMEGLLTRRHEKSLIDRHWNDLAMAGDRLDDGNEIHEVTLIEIGDYECPFCRRAFLEVEALAGDAGVVYLQYPLTGIHPAAEGASRAAVCASEQGRFRQMHSLLYESTEWISDQRWQEMASLTGMDNPALFLECLGAPRTDSTLANHRMLADLIGITGTPLFLTRHRMFRGLPPMDELKGALGAR